MLTFKRKLILTQDQAKRLDSWIGCCRLIYNMCLEIRKEAYKNKQITIHKYAFDVQIKEIRDIEWVNDAPFECLSNAVKRMDLAYRSFFRGGGFPKFASKRKYNSIKFVQNLSIKGDCIRVSKIGYIKMTADAPISGEIKTISIKRECGAYYACIVTDAVKSIQNQDESQILALDMGIARLFTDSEGRFSENPKHFKKYEKKLRVENRSLSRKKRFGKNWQKQAKRLAKLHHKIANVRKDYLHKESTRVAANYHYVILEDLNVAGMSRSRLSKHILDAGWGMFRQMLEYKTTVIPINPRFTSQTCNDCGEKDKKSRISQSEFVCTSCGAKSHADENAAKNILSLGKAVIAQRKAVA